MGADRRVVIVSSFPPTICGIGQYAEAQARVLEAEGARVDRVDVDDPNGALRSAHGAARLLELARRADELWVQYQVSFFFNPRLRPFELGVAAALAPITLALRVARRSYVVVHEMDPVLFKNRSRRLQRAATMVMFRAADTLVFHTDRERDAFSEAMFSPRDARVIGAGAFYRKRIGDSRAEARRALALPSDELLFVCIGFFHEGKGFAEFAEQFQRACDEGALPGRARLAIVTSLRSGPPAQFDRFRERVRALSRVCLVDGYVSDDDFDRWLVAADRVVAPYRYGVTSSIVARAAVYGVPAIISAAGYLAEQRGPDDLVYSTDDELRRCLAQSAR